MRHFEEYHNILLLQSNLHQRPPLYNGHFFLADSPYIDSCLNLSITATFLCPHGGRCGELQLGRIWVVQGRSRLCLCPGKNWWNYTWYYSIFVLWSVDSLRSWRD